MSRARNIARLIGDTAVATGQVSGLTTVQTGTINVANGFAGGFINGGRQAAPFTAAVGYHYNVVSGCTFVLPTTPGPMAKISISLSNVAATYGIDPNGNKYGNVSTATTGIPGGQSGVLCFDDGLGDWE